MSEDATPEQVLKAAAERYPDADYIAPIYCIHTSKYKVITEPQHHFELIVTKRTKRWVLWPFWSREREERIATHRAPTLRGLLSKLGACEV